MYYYSMWCAGKLALQKERKKKKKPQLAVFADFYNVYIHTVGHLKPPTLCHWIQICGLKFSWVWAGHRTPLIITMELSKDTYIYTFINT